MKDFIYDMWDRWCRYRYVDPVFSFAKVCLTTGAALAAGGVGWAFTLIIPEWNIPVTIEFGPQQPILLGTVLIIVGLFLGFWRIRTSSKKVGCFLIDHRGMEGMDLGDPQKFLPGSCKTGEVRVVRIGFSDNKKDVLKKIEALNERLNQDFSGDGNGKADLVYAGLAPVPFLFYAGVSLTSRKQCKIILDWDRHLGVWHEPSKPSQNLSFDIVRPEQPVVEDIAIAMPLSAPFGDTPVVATVGDMPIMWLKLQDGTSQDSIASSLDQQRLAREFYDVLAGLREEYPNLKKVHLFVAAQASFIFRMGQQYSTTVHPPIQVYGFNANRNIYDWNVRIEGDAEIQELNNLVID
ncbi:MAG: SAVED domain-containing protein [Anaerolineales bacterium]